MSCKKNVLPMPSLAGHFDAPDDHVGHFGWLCGYSADAPFLDDALTRFTRMTAAQRAAQGRIFLAVMLDAGNPPILSTDVPGVAHLLLKKGQPFRLLHAKVALLGFRHRTEPGRWWLRLLVSTGNWTRQTVEESLDLAWRLDVTQEGCEDAADGIGQDRADIRAAWDLLQWLQGYVDTRLLDATTDGRPSESSLARQCVARWLDACGARAEAPRFFDSRKASLLKGLLKKLNNHGVKRCSRLVLGSGFFESGTDARKELVPLRIVREFKENSFLTSRPRVDIFVDPDSCQVMAKAGTLDSLKNAGFHLRPAAPPEAVFGERAATRNLHAKFIFSAASGRKDEDACCGAWLYLGSGNLTRPGFIDKMSSTGGNLEAGVLLFPPEGLRWKQKNGVNGVDAGKVITNLLPVQWDTEITTADALKSGPGKEEQREAFFAPPVAHLFWDDGDGQQTLGTRGDCPASLEVLNPQGRPCPRKDGVFEWKDARPCLVHIRWQEEGCPQEALVPVVDRWGRVAVRELPALDTEDVWWQLASFPLPPEKDDEDVSGVEEGGERAGKGRAASGGPATGADYPIRRMMELVEHIAAQQTEIREEDWQLWCLRLEQTLMQARDCASVVYFREVLKLDPLYPLFEPCFRPSFAEDRRSECGRRYEDALQAVRKCWQVHELPGLGEDL